MKKSAIMLLSMLLLLVCSARAEAAAPQVIVDAQIISFASYPYPIIENNCTLVPISIFEVLGADIVSNYNSDHIFIRVGDSLIEMQVGSDKAYLNGVLKKLPVPIKRVDGCPMFPIRLVSQVLFAEVNWRPQTSTILVSSKEVIYVDHEVTQGLESQMDKARAIHDWICQNIRYEPYSDGPACGGCNPQLVLKNSSPAVAFQHRQADVAGFAKLNLALLNRAGITAQTIGGAYKPGCPTIWNKSGDWGYWCWNRALVDGKWIIIDTALDAESKGTESKYFNPNPDEFEKNHKADRIWNYVFSDATGK